MPFTRIKCPNCAGQKRIVTPYGFPLNRGAMLLDCTACEGKGFRITHPSADGSRRISFDPGAAEGDATWASLWQVHEDGTLELLDSGPVRDSND